MSEDHPKPSNLRLLSDYPLKEAGRSEKSRSGPARSYDREGHESQLQSLMPFVMPIKIIKNYMLLERYCDPNPAEQINQDFLTLERLVRRLSEEGVGGFGIRQENNRTKTTLNGASYPDVHHTMSLLFNLPNGSRIIADAEYFDVHKNPCRLRVVVYEPAGSGSDERKLYPDVARILKVATQVTIPSCFNYSPSKDSSGVFILAGMQGGSYMVPT